MYALVDSQRSAGQSYRNLLYFKDVDWHLANAPQRKHDMLQLGRWPFTVPCKTLTLPTNTLFKYDTIVVFV